jgi:RHS repeat-associated protein
MVALNKTYRKTLTPDRSAKDSGLRFYSAEISRWLSRDPIGEQGGLDLYGFVGNNVIGGTDRLGLYHWGEQGPYSSQMYTNSMGLAITRWWPDGNWNLVRPGHDTPCCYKPARHTWRRTDNYVSYAPLAIRMSVDLSFDGYYKELVLLWDTCERITTLSTAYIPSCGNQTACYLSIAPWQPYLGNYKTTVAIAYLSCEMSASGTLKWKTRGGQIYRNYKGGNFGWQHDPDVVTSW